MLQVAAPMLIIAALATTPPSAVCPPNDRSPIVSQAPGARSSLVPTGAVSLTVCRYYGLANRSSSRRARPFGLAAQGTTRGAAEIARFGAELDALRPTPGGVAYGCPADFGTKLLALFRYRSGPADVVTIGLSGCNTITNGHVLRLGLDAPVIDQLERLAR